LISCANCTLQQKYLLFQLGGQHLIWLIGMKIIYADDISLFGSYDDSIFRDTKGHQGKIVVNTGALIWLNGLYGANLRTNDANTGFNTDLHTIAENIMDLHDQNYKQQ